MGLIEPAPSVELVHSDLGLVIQILGQFSPSFLYPTCALVPSARKCPQALGVRKHAHESANITKRVHVFDLIHQSTNCNNTEAETYDHRHFILYDGCPNRIRMFLMALGSEILYASVAITGMTPCSQLRSQSFRTRLDKLEICLRRKF